jgi:hypothetical protein
LWNLRETDPLEKTGIEGRIILRWIFKTWDAWAWTGLSCLRIETEGSPCKNGNEHSGFIKIGKFLTSREPVSFA